MIKSQRHARILSLLRQHTIASVGQLTAMLGDVSAVTVRRDLAELANDGAVRRTRGGAMLREPAHDPVAEVAPWWRPHGSAVPSEPAGRAIPQPAPCAVILPPVAGVGAEALRRRIVRDCAFYLAESAPQPGGVYLGPDNFAAGRDLGERAGRDARRRCGRVRVLIVGQDTLGNTLKRERGFRDGLEDALPGRVDFVRVNGRGAYAPALRAAVDALKATPGLDVVFGINDDSTRAAMDAAQRLDRAVLAYGVGGESPSFVAGLLAGPSLRAVAALFPEVVGERAIDVAASTLGGDRVPREVLTPHEILTPDNLHEFYRRHEGDWSLRDEIRDRLVGATMAFRSLRLEGRVGFMPQFPAHEWYRAMSRAMHRRCAHYGLELSVVSPEQGVFEELGRLRSLVAASALERVRAGDTIVIGHGDCGSRLADAIRVACAGGDGRLTGLTVVTPSLTVLERLQGAPGVRTILTGGEPHLADRCLVGPALEAVFERLRADRAFLSVDGLSVKFGLASNDEPMALANRCLAGAAEEVIVLADHSIVGAPAPHRIAGIEAAHVVIVDDALAPECRYALHERGARLIVVDEPDPLGDSPQNRRAPARGDAPHGRPA